MICISIKTKLLIRIMKTSFVMAHLYFNVYPNLSLSLTDPNILESISLNIKTNGYDIMPGTEQ